MPAAPRREKHAQQPVPSTGSAEKKGDKTSDGGRRAFPWAAAALGLFLLAVGIEVVRWLNDPHVYFLQPESRAEWIRLDHVFSLNLYPPVQTGLMFEYPLHIRRSR